MKQTITTFTLSILALGVYAQTPTLVKSNINGQELFSYDGNAYFANYDNQNSTSTPWMSDGSTAGTIQLSTSINAGMGFTKAGNYVYFSGSDMTTSESGLYKTNGTVAGTGLVKKTGASFVNYYNGCIEFNNKLVFTANDGVVGEAPWITDGTLAGTTRIASHQSAWGSFIHAYQKSNNKVVFLANTQGTHPSFDAYSYDGTTETKLSLVSEAPFANFATTANPENPFTINGNVYYAYEAASPQQIHVQKSNGSNFIDVAFLPTGTKWMVATSTAVYFQMFNIATGAELYKADLNFNNVTLVKDINPGAPGSYAAGLVVMNDIVYFMAIDGTNGMELWRSDGTDAGTTLVKDIAPGSTGSMGLGAFAHEPRITVFCNKIYFTANDGTHGQELWRSDGTTAGTELVMDIAPGTPDAGITELNMSNGRMYFFAYDGTGTGLWKIDGCLIPASAEAVRKGEITFALYPNPAGNELNIETDEVIVGVHCVNSMGQSALVTLRNKQLDISSLASGVYFLTATTGTRSSTKKFIKY